MLPVVFIGKGYNLYLFLCQMTLPYYQVFIGSNWKHDTRVDILIFTPFLAQCYDMP